MKLSFVKGFTSNSFSIILVLKGVLNNAIKRAKDKRYNIIIDYNHISCSWTNN